VNRALFRRVAASSAVVLPYITHKMGHESVLLSMEHLEFGVGELLAFLADERSVEARRPPAPPDGGVWIHTVAGLTFLDGSNFELQLISPTRRRYESALTMLWYWAEGSPQSPSWRLDVDVEVGYYPWPNCKDFPGFADFRKFRSVLDEFARPRLIVPAAHAGQFRADYLALIALFAVKGRCMARTEDLVRHFRAYCSGLFQDTFDKLCRRRRGSRHGLAPEEWTGLVDKVFERLYHGKAGLGFTMPTRPESFRAYIWRALRGEFARQGGRRRGAGNRGSFPQSVEDAAAVLGVSGMTVRRLMKQLGSRAWSLEVWESISGQLKLKQQWQALAKELENSGSKPDAARKKVYRWKKDGLTPGEARERISPTHPRGVCSACGEADAIGAEYRGKFLCSECLAEKLGITGTEH
jgi:hypothetical protein